MKKRSAMRCRQRSRRGRFGGRTSSLPRSYGTPIIVLNGSSPPLTRVCRRLQLDYVDCYLIHTPFAFRPGDEQDPRDEHGQVIYDSGVTLVETWRALERLVDDGQCKSIGLSDVTLEKLREIVAAARIKPAVVQVESHPYLPEWDLLDFCREHGIVLLAFAALGHGLNPKVLDDPGDHSHRTARAQDAGSGCAGLGRTARHRFPDHLDQHLATSRRTLRYRPCLKTPCGRSGRASRRTSGSTRWWRPACLALFPEPVELNSSQCASPEVP